MQYLRDISYLSYEALLAAGNIDVSEKLDGSCFRFGSDEHGFYSGPKGAKKYRSERDYDQYWHNDMRYAHFVCEEWFYKNFPQDTLLDVDINAEIIGCHRPNTIRYGYYARNIVITSDLSEYGIDYNPFNYVEYFNAPGYYIHSDDGIVQQTTHEDLIWAVRLNHHKPMKLTAITGLSPVAPWIKENVTRRLIASLPDSERELIQRARLEFRNHLIRIEALNTPDELYNGEPNKEGIVIRSDNHVMFKLIHTHFKPWHHYFYRWQNLLTGPEYSWKMAHKDSSYVVASDALRKILDQYNRDPYKDQDAHARTLLLFSEERKRLELRRTKELTDMENEYGR